MDLLRIGRSVILFFLLDGKFMNSNSDVYWSLEWPSCTGFLLLDLSALSF